MNEELINIIKKPGIKNAIRINEEKDIPDFLKEVIKIENEMIVLDCLEGIESVPLGSVIAYEKLDSGKMNVWNKSNWKETLKEEDGVFYEIPKILKATPLDSDIPAFVKESLGNNLVIEGDTCKLNTSFGLLSCKINQGYLVIYGINEDGSLNVNMVDKSTPSFKEYFVVDDNAEIIETLEEYDTRIKREFKH